MKYLEDNKLLSDNQLGFRKGHSTTEAIYYLLEKMNKSINTSEYCLNVFIDFSKAFDSITHEILISKLSSFGISEATINWFRSYLSNRKQCVILNNHFSDSLPVLYGVPQGSVLGPTLFIMYVNDIFTSQYYHPTPVNSPHQSTLPSHTSEYYQHPTPVNITTPYQSILPSHISEYYTLGTAEQSDWSICTTWPSRKKRYWTKQNDIGRSAWKP